MQNRVTEKLPEAPAKEGAMLRRMTVLVMVAAFAAGTARADDCFVPMTDWQPREAVAKLAADKGWAVRRIKIDDGCYEIIGRDAEGRAIEVKVNPGTLAIIEMEYEKEHDDDDDENGEKDD